MIVPVEMLVGMVIISVVLDSEGRLEGTSEEEFMVGMTVPIEALTGLIVMIVAAGVLVEYAVSEETGVLGIAVEFHGVGTALLYDGLEGVRVTSTVLVPSVTETISISFS